jgi:hypothetical protein
MGAGQAVVMFIALLFVVLGAIAAVRVTRAVKRGVERTVADTRRTVQETTLKARRYVQPGPVGEIASLRLALRESIDSTRGHLQARLAHDPGLRESLDLLDRLHEHARVVDGELRLLEREPDRTRLATRLAECRERVRRIRESADSLRWAAQDRARHSEGDDLDSLQAQIDLETGALRHWTPAGEEPASGEPGKAAGARPSGARAAIPPVQKGAQDAFQLLLDKIDAKLEKSRGRRPGSPPGPTG